MRLIVAAVAASLLATSAHAASMAHCNEAWKAASPADKATTTYKAYMARCLKKSGTGILPVVAVAPKGATARCNDGSYSTSRTISGRCSGHGGVATSL
jgi:hypothetical protein